MDWVPVLWFGAFTLAVLMVAVALLRWAHPLAGSIQLLVAIAVLIITITVWRAEYERAHPAPLPSCPTRAGVPCRALHKLPIPTPSLSMHDTAREVALATGRLSPRSKAAGVMRWGLNVQVSGYWILAHHAVEHEEAETLADFWRYAVRRWPCLPFGSASMDGAPNGS